MQVQHSTMVLSREEQLRNNAACKRNARERERTERREMERLLEQTVEFQASFANERLVSMQAQSMMAIQAAQSFAAAAQQNSAVFQQQQQQQMLEKAALMQQVQLLHQELWHASEAQQVVLKDLRRAEDEYVTAASNHVEAMDKERKKCREVLREMELRMEVLCACACV